MSTPPAQPVPAGPAAANTSTPQPGATPRPPAPEEIRRAFESGKYPYARKMARKAYEEEKESLKNLVL